MHQYAYPEAFLLKEVTVKQIFPFDPFGHQFRGPLDELRENWKEADAPEGPKVSYELRMQEQLLKTMGPWHVITCCSPKGGRKTGMTAQQEHKVLGLVTRSFYCFENKLLAMWQGLDPVKQRMGPLTYEIHIPESKEATADVPYQHAP